jgi:predicted ester cyclase
VHDELLDRFQAAVAARDAGAIGAVCTPDLHYEDPFSAAPLTGPAALAEHAELLFQGFSDARIETAGPRLRDGDAVAAPVKILGTHRGELLGLPPSGRFVVVHGVLWCALDPAGERLWRVRLFADAYDAGVQAGILPARGTLGSRALLALRGFGLRLSP